MSPPNRTHPDNPGRNKVFVRGNSLLAETKLAKWPPRGQIRGQNGDDGQHGTINVPLVAQTCAWRITLGIRGIGGHHQLTSPVQFTVKASTASEPGFQQRLLNLGS